MDYFRFVLMVFCLVNKIVHCTTPLTYREIALHIDDQSTDPLATAHAIAKNHSFVFVKEIFPNSNYYLFYKIANNCTHVDLCSTPRRFKRASDTHVQNRLGKEPMVNKEKVFFNQNLSENFNCLGCCRHSRSNPMARIRQDHTRYWILAWSNDAIPWFIPGILGWIMTETLSWSYKNKDLSKNLPWFFQDSDKNRWVSRHSKGLHDSWHDLILEVQDPWYESWTWPYKNSDLGSQNEICSFPGWLGSGTATENTGQTLQSQVEIRLQWSNVAKTLVHCK
jgi:hypothetical protein